MGIIDIKILTLCWLFPMATKLAGLDLEPLYVSANISYQSINDFWLFMVKSPVQMSGAGVRWILRSMYGSVQLKNLRLKSLTKMVFEVITRYSFPNLIMQANHYYYKCFLIVFFYILTTFTTNPVIFISITLTSKITAFTIY